VLLGNLEQYSFEALHPHPGSPSEQGSVDCVPNDEVGEWQFMDYTRRDLVREGRDDTAHGGFVDMTERQNNVQECTKEDIIYTLYRFAGRVSEETCAKAPGAVTRHRRSYVKNQNTR
jgi:hypothetical protein